MKYPFADLKVGESFLYFWQHGEPKHVIQGRLISAAIKHLGKGNYTTHQEAAGCRVRRTR